MLPESRPQAGERARLHCIVTLSQTLCQGGDRRMVKDVSGPTLHRALVKVLDPEMVVLG